MDLGLHCQRSDQRGLRYESSFNVWLASIVAGMVKMSYQWHVRSILQHVTCKCIAIHGRPVLFASSGQSICYMASIAT